MTAAQTIQLKLSTYRQRLNELLGVETRSSEQQTEMETLTKEVSAKEPELRAALAAEIRTTNETYVDGSDARRPWNCARLIHAASPGQVFSRRFTRAGTRTDARRKYKIISVLVETNCHTPCSKSAHKRRHRRTWQLNRPRLSNRFSVRRQPRF